MLPAITGKSKVVCSTQIVTTYIQLDAQAKAGLNKEFIMRKIKMKLKPSVLITALSLSMGITALPAVNQSSAHASSWHTSASIPVPLRGHWYAKANPRQGVNIYRHYIHFSGEKSVRITKWRYVGNHFYHFHYRGDQGYPTSLHYFSSHKITMNSFWHTYFR